jgi:hypothetical protein
MPIRTRLVIAFWLCAAFAQADLPGRIAQLTNALAVIRATTNTTRMAPFDLLKSAGIAEALLQRADMTLRGTIPPPRWPWVLTGYTSSTGMVDAAEEYITILQTDRDPLIDRFTESDGTVIDHCLIKKDGVHHLFYIRGKACTHWPEWPTRYFGHATSTDLVHWTVAQPVLHSPDVGWDNYQVWAPHIVQFNGSYWMFYTGVSSNPVTQAIGLATSTNLYDWQRVGNGPIFTPGPWAYWSSNTDTTCRDPMVFRDDDGTFYCYYTAQRPNWTFCVGVASSTNLLNWTDRGFITLASSTNTPPESPYLVKRGPTNYYLIYTSYSHGIVYATATNPVTGWADAPMPGFVICGGSASEPYLDDGAWRMSVITHEVNALHFFEIRNLFWHTNGTVTVRKFPTPLTGLTGLLYQDTYDHVAGAGPVNTGVTNIGRQAGALAPIAYKYGGTTLVGATGANPGQLTLRPGAWAAPFYNFSDTGDFVIEFDLLCQMGLGTNAWLTFQCGAPGWGAYPQSSSGFGLFFFGHGWVQTFADSVPLAMVSCDLRKKRHVMISISTPDFSGTNAALIAVFIDGRPLVVHDTTNGGTNDFVYRMPSGFSANYMTFATLAGGAPYFATNSVIDNFTVRNVAYAPRAQAAWTNDFDLPLSTNKTYTHAVKLNAHAGNCVVRGVTFTGVTATSSATWSLTSPDGVGNHPDDIGLNAVQPAGSYLLEYMTLVNAGRSACLYLSNLTAGASYRLTLYSRGMDTPIVRRNVVMAGSDGAAPAMVDQNAMGNGNGQCDTYSYVAGADGTFALALTPLLAGHGWNYFAFSNERVLPPTLQVAATLVFGDVPLHTNQQLVLPIHNLGDGVVSGTLARSGPAVFALAATTYHAVFDAPAMLPITFAPAEQLAYTNMLTLTGSGTNTSVVVTLLGTSTPEPAAMVVCLMAVPAARWCRALHFFHIHQPKVMS